MCDSVCEWLMVLHLVFQLQDKKLIPTAEADDKQPDHQLETVGHRSNQVDSLRFEVKFILY